MAQRCQPGLKVLSTSGYAELSRFGGDLAHHPLLKKPFKLETFSEAVQAALQPAFSHEPDNVVRLRRDQP